MYLCQKMLIYYNNTYNETSIIIFCCSKNLLGRQVRYYQMISKLGHNLISILVVTIQLPYELLPHMSVMILHYIINTWPQSGITDITHCCYYIVPSVLGCTLF